MNVLNMTKKNFGTRYNGGEVKSAVVANATEYYGISICVDRVTGVSSLIERHECCVLYFMCVIV